MLQDIENLPSSKLIKIYSKQKGDFKDTGAYIIVETAKLPNVEDCETEFFIRFNEDIPVYWLYVNNKKFNNKFYCTICNDFYCGGGSNVKTHLNTMKHMTAAKAIMFSPLDSFILWMLKHNVSFNSVNDELFYMFVSKPFSYGKIMERIEELHNLLKESIAQILSNQRNIVLIADGWTDARERRYMGLGVRYIEDCQIKHLFLGLIDIHEIHHSAKVICSSILEYIKSYQIDIEKISSFCSDSAPVMSNVADEMGLDWDPCFVHLFNNCIKNYIEESDEIYTVLKKANKALKKEVFVEFLEINGAPLSNIKKYCKTRWMSCFDTLDSIVRLKPFIQGYTKETGEELFNGNDFEIIEIIHPFFKSLNEAYEILLQQEDDFFSSMIFKVISTIIKLINTVENDQQDISFKLLRDLIIETFLDIEKPSCRRIIYATILDKSHKIPSWLEHSEEYETITNMLQAEIDQIRNADKEESEDEIIAVPANNEKSKKYDLSKSFYENLMSATSDEPPSENDPSELMTFVNRPKTSKSFFDFWTSPKHRLQYPNLSKFVDQLFPHSFTSLYIERCFSLCKRILGKDRLALTKEHVSMLAMLRINIDLVSSICRKS